MEAVSNSQSDEYMSHAGSSPASHLDAQPHHISLAIWDVPSPLVRQRPAKMKIGVKCSAGCRLTGQSVEILDEAGATVASGTLGQNPWHETAALYWTEIELPDPADEGTYSWSAQFTPSDTTAPHEGASLTFSFLAVKAPEHGVLVRVIEKNTQAGIENAEVRLGVYKARSDSSGCARIEVPTGTYDLNAWKLGYQAEAKTVDVAENVTVQLEVVTVPETADPYWM
jgi:hypothetical protein